MNINCNINLFIVKLAFVYLWDSISKSACSVIPLPMLRMGSFKPPILFVLLRGETISF